MALRDRLSAKIVASPPCPADTTAVGCGDSAAAGVSGFRIKAATAIAIATTERNMFSIRTGLLLLHLARNAGAVTTSESPGLGRLSSGVAHTRCGHRLPDEGQTEGERVDARWMRA